MARRLQGITVELGGDTTILQTALKGENMLSGIEGDMNLAAASGEDLATTSESEKAVTDYKSTK